VTVFIEASKTLSIFLLNKAVYKCRETLIAFPESTDFTLFPLEFLVYTTEKIGHLYELKRSANRMACLPAGSVYPRSQTTPHSSTISLTQLAWYFWARTSVCSKEDNCIEAVSNKNPFTPHRTVQPSPSRSWPGTSGPAPLSAARRITV
jgi:hypothetical protein